MGKSDGRSNNIRLEKKDSITNRVFFIPHEMVLYDVIKIRHKSNNRLVPIFPGNILDFSV